MQKMDKYEFNIKVEQIKKLVNKGDYETAMKIADTIDWRRVRSASLLTMIAQIYERNEEYEDAKDILLLAFERAPIGKRLLYKLTDLALKEGNVDEAEAYYREFCDLAADDPRQHLLRYMILAAKDAPMEQQIHSLESFCNEELDEKWLYRLAELYHACGRKDDCIRICDKIMLLFGLGKYVDKAMELKQEFAPLSQYQQDLVENRDKYERRLRAVEQEFNKPGASGDDYDDDTDDAADMDEDMENESAPDEEFKDGYAGEDTAAAAVNSAEPLSDDVARIHEAAAEEKLAREMSKIAVEEYSDDREQKPVEETRVIGDIRRLRAARDAKAGTSGEELSAGSSAVQEETPVPASNASVADAFASNASAADTSAGGTSPSRGEISPDADVSAVSGTPERAADNGDAVDAADARDVADARRAAMETAAAGMSSPASGDSSLDMEIEDWDEDPAAAVEHLIIEADDMEKGLDRALEELRRICRDTGVKNPVAKISGEKLNQRGVFASAAKLAGKNLIIEKAADLNDRMIEELIQLMGEDASGMRVVLIDTPASIDYLHTKYPVMFRKFRTVVCRSGRQPHADVEDDVYRELTANKALEKEADAEEAAARTAAARGPEKAERRQERVKRQPEAVRDDELRQSAAPEKKRAKASMEQQRRKEVETDREADRIMAEKVAAADRAENERPDDQKVMDVEEFAQYACKYASEIDCSITGKSLLALYERVEMMDEDGVSLTKKEAEDLIEEAADKAEKPSFFGAIRNIFSPKYDKDGLLILKERHFFD